MLRNPQQYDQVFAHLFNGTEIRINVSKLRQYLDSHPAAPKVKLDIEEKLVERLLVNNGVEKHRLARLISLSKEEFSNLPIPIIITFRDHTWVLADGNHQTCAAHFRGISQLQVYKVKPKIWERFFAAHVGNVPYFGFSGIP